MTSAAATLTTALGWGTLLLQLFTLLLIVLFLRERLRGVASGLLLFIRTWALHLGLVAALTGSALTLVYSEIFGFLPCGLCWLQRVFLYPQVILFALSLWKKDRGIGDYILGLSVPGFLIALYQHFIQVGGTSFLPCPATPGAADCAQRLIFELGYITFPLMAASLFGFLIVLSYIMRRLS